MSKDSVRLLAAGLKIGQTLDHIECPFCQVRHENKFSVTRTEGGVLYNCYRAKCGEAGFVPDYGSWERRSTPDAPVNRPYLGKLYPLDEDDERFFKLCWGAVPFGTRVAESGHYAFPLYDYGGNNRGWVLRNPVWKGRECHRGSCGGAKSLTYKNRGDEPGISWSSPAVGTPKIVLTEDYISACKVSLTDWMGVALNGTHLTYEAVKEIKSVSPVAVVIWLDPGAEQQAYKILNKWGLSFNFCCVIIGDKDPKDYSVEEIREKLSVIGW